MIHIIVEQFCSKKAPLVKKNNRIMFYSPSQVSVLIATLTLNISDRPPPHRPTKLNSREFACKLLVQESSRRRCTISQA